MKYRNWFWGIFFILAAVFVVAMKLGALENISMFSVILSVFLFAAAIKSLVHFEFFGFTIPIALILSIYRKELGIPTSIIPEHGFPWVLIAVAVFLAIGLSMIFKKKHSWKERPWNEGWAPFGNNKHSNTNVNYTSAGNVENITNDEIWVNISFGATTKYINSSSLRRVNLKCSFGAIKVFMNDVQLDPNGTEIYIESSFSGIELYLPKSWRVENCIASTLGGVDEKNKQYVSDGPLVRLTGNVNLGGVEVVYV